jgi:hypothetical protein
VLPDTSQKQHQENSFSRLAWKAGAATLYRSVILLTFFLAGLAKTVFDPALQAYVGERVPFQKRGLVLASSSLSGQEVPL